MLVGIDVVETARIRRLHERHGERMHRTIGSPAETHWVGESVSRLAALFAIKESVIKALGGRAPGFRWTDIVVAPSSAVPQPASATFKAFGAGIPVAVLAPAQASLGGASGEWATVALGGTPVVAACWGESDEHVYAAATLWRAGL